MESQRSQRHVSVIVSQIIPLGERHLRRAVKEYAEHYHVERNQQGLDNRLIEKPHGVSNMDSAVVRHERLGGVLNCYERRAASTVGGVAAHYEDEHTTVRDLLAAAGIRCPVKH